MNGVRPGHGSSTSGGCDGSRGAVLFQLCLSAIENRVCDPWGAIRSRAAFVGPVQELTCFLNIAVLYGLSTFCDLMHNECCTLWGLLLISNSTSAPIALIVLTNLGHLVACFVNVHSQPAHLTSKMLSQIYCWPQDH